MDQEGRVPLLLPAEVGRTGCLRLLLEAGAQTDLVSPEGIPSRTPPIVLICEMGDIQALKTILDFQH